MGWIASPNIRVCRWATNLDVKNLLRSIALQILFLATMIWSEEAACEGGCYMGWSVRAISWMAWWIQFIAGGLTPPVISIPYCTPAVIFVCGFLCFCMKLQHKFKEQHLIFSSGQVATFRSLSNSSTLTFYLYQNRQFLSPNLVIFTCSFFPLIV